MGQAQMEHQFLASNVPADNTSAFSFGFVLGQTAAYLEQVNAGAKLAAQIGCQAKYIPAVREMAEKEGCRIVVDRTRGEDRIGIWMFKLPFVETIIAEMSKDKTTPPNALEVWSMGKLFGYSDSEIGGYLQVHELVKSASDSESSPRPFEGKSGWRKEQKYRPG